MSYRTLRKASVTAPALVSVYRDNVRMLRTAVAYCRAVLRTRLYRMPSGLLPWLDCADPQIAEAAEAAFAECLPHLRGALVGFGDVRVTSHPDQFCVLSSDRPDVVASSVRMLVTESRVMDALGLPRSPWAGVNVHGGKADRLAQLRAVVDALPDAVRARLTVRGRWSPHAPILQRHAESAMRTWADPAEALAHLSNGVDGPHDRRHSDLIDFVFPSLSEYGWIDVEAKGKERAIAALRGAAPIVNRLLTDDVRSGKVDTWKTSL